ncbi:N-acylneuraminate cytidylyltransferase [Microbacterium endophyticum]|uniref:N-acylneuraminate cytidylyltransferase n=1 Tax=Microbacterium endophyticum TaxID=1526412 RepID=A0A7W4YN52_9MICO|nr:acylneuraminate cytidylyltransferase [Microbacterium endophyticum]MBB2976868.1 N-acylneuraminate cytidylyltransferase [Microbacterium endophyticum]NIK35814.1 N-acylneuraminate cytidylyltransferase [Microbacterium endophyticum]
MSEVIAIIPARGGSKGIPGKNLQRVGGIPLVARAVAAARAAESIDRVVVSTDDVEIARVATEWGATVVDRPAALSGDEASSESALRHAIMQLCDTTTDVATVVFVQATSPFIDPSDIDQAVDMVTSGTHECVFSAVETYGFLWAPDATGDTHGINHDRAVRPRRQDREPHFLETGAFYVMDAEGFLEAGHRFFGRVGFVAVDECSAIEIDDHTQLELARALAPLMVTGGEPIDVDAVVTDFDGVHTDDTATVDSEGREYVRVSRSDGAGVAALRRAEVPLLILSTETNAVVSARASKLGVDVHQGVSDKLAVLTEWAAGRGIPLDRIAYVGNDINDLSCLEAVGWPVAVPGSHPMVLAAARVVTDHAGGDGAVREVAERVLDARTSAAPKRAAVSPATTERSAT